MLLQLYLKTVLERRAGRKAILMYKFKNEFVPECLSAEFIALNQTTHGDLYKRFFL